MSSQTPTSWITAPTANMVPDSAVSVLYSCGTVRQEADAAVRSAGPCSTGRGRRHCRQAWGSAVKCIPAMHQEALPALVTSAMWAHLEVDGARNHAEENPDNLRGGSGPQPNQASTATGTLNRALAMMHRCTSGMQAARLACGKPEGCNLAHSLATPSAHPLRSPGLLA